MLKNIYSKERGNVLMQASLEKLKCHKDQNIIPIFLQILKACSLNTYFAKFLALSFIQRLFILSVNFGFHGPPLLSFKTDQLDLRRLDPEKMTSFTH